MVKVTNFGEYTESYKKLNRYIQYLRMHNLGTMLKIQLETRERDSDPLIFRRIFIMFDVIKKEFLESCKQLIGVDGCHLKGPYGDIFLSAIVLYGNKGVLL